MSLHIHMPMKNQIKHQTAWLDFYFYITEMIYCNLTIFWYFIPQNLMKRKIISLRSLIRWTLFHNPIMTQFLSCFPTIAFCGNCIYLPHLENRNSSALLSPSLWFLFFIIQETVVCHNYSYIEYLQEFLNYWNLT